MLIYLKIPVLYAFAAVVPPNIDDNKAHLSVEFFNGLSGILFILTGSGV